jgi:hypothetical protein
MDSWHRTVEEDRHYKTPQKSFGSKKPFTFILWCTRSCIKHKNDAGSNLEEMALTFVELEKKE